jgi:hypothetical protein
MENDKLFGEVNAASGGALNALLPSRFVNSWADRSAWRAFHPCNPFEFTKMANLAPMLHLRVKFFRFLT